MPVVAQQTSGGLLTPGWFIVAVTAVGLAALFAARRRVVGTTLIAAWWWATLSLVCVAGTELIVACWGDLSAATVECCRFAAAVSTFCPAMAVLGAKRPQHVAWQFIVLALWSILVLPSGEALLFGRGGLELDVVRSWFLLILIGMALMNYLPTRFALSGLLVAAGQVILLWRFIPRPAIEATPPPIAGLSLLVVGGLLFALDWPRARSTSEPLDRLWRDFRDLYGAAWALRLAQRLNASTTMSGWGVTLGWSSFVDSAGRPGAVANLGPQQQATIESSLRTLLRRFVSPDWIDARLG